MDSSTRQAPSPFAPAVLGTDYARVGQLAADHVTPWRGTGPTVARRSFPMGHGDTDRVVIVWS